MTRAPGLPALLASVVSLAGAALTFAAPQAFAGEGYYRFPTLTADKLVFTAEGDLWSVPLGGGAAARLTSHAAEETRASASPDGKWIAFDASYDGVQEVYVIPVTGGSPKRVTFDGGPATTVGWTPSGEVLYATQSAKGPSGQLVISAVDPGTLARHTYPLAEANDAAVSADGKWLFFTRYGRSYVRDNMRSYRGGMMSRIWRYDLSDAREAEVITADEPANLRRPMLSGDKLYVISDSDGCDNLWSMDLDGKNRRQLTHFKDYCIGAASLSKGRIAFQLGADIHIFTLADQTDRKVAIDLVSDFDQTRTHVVKTPLDAFESARFAPDGRHAVVTALGRVAVMGPNAMRRVDIDLPRDLRPRLAQLSPDGRTVYAAVSSATGTEIWRMAADGSSERAQITHDDAGIRTGLWLSPDGKTLAQATRDGRLLLLNIATGVNTEVEKAPSPDIDHLVWSKDGRYLAYVRSGAIVERSQVFLYEPATGQRATVTSAKYTSSRPTFTPDGKWLYFLSDRALTAQKGSPWGDRNLGPAFDHRTRVYAVALQNGLRFPYLAADELSDASKAPKDPEADGEDKPKAKPALDAKAKPKAPAPAIDWANLSQRLYVAPVDAGNYSALATDGKRLYLLADAEEEKPGTIVTFDIKNDGEKVSVYLGNVESFELSADGSKIFVRRGGKGGKTGQLQILPTDRKLAPDFDFAKATLHAGEWSVEVDPKLQWRQMFSDAWLMHKEYFYDSRMRGVDWTAVRAKYAPLVDRVTERDELNDVLGQMIAELGTLHSQVARGELRKAHDGSEPGFLGADLQREADSYRVAHIYRSDPELPDERAPLARPEVDVEEGDLITSVNGRTVAGVPDIALLLANQARNQVLLTLNRKGRTVKTVVVAIDGKTNAALRYGDWEENRRRRVETASGGKIGYLHLRAMGGEDIAAFAREFYAQYEKDGLIIDVRRNNGGSIDSWIIEKLLRRTWAFWAPRNASVHFTNMQQTFRGHLVVLVDERTYSDGETFAAGIKALHLAPLIGRRTAGAGVWLDDDNPLVDNGRARVAELGQYALADGAQLVEGKGVTPDIEIDNPPHATFLGGDAQLEKALAVLQEQLKADPVKPY